MRARRAGTRRGGGADGGGRGRAPAETSPPGPGAVGNGGFVAYGARSPVWRLGAKHAQSPLFFESARHHHDHPALSIP